MSWNERHKKTKKFFFFKTTHAQMKLCYAQAICEKLIWFFCPPEGSSVIMNTEISRSEAFEMLLLRHFSNSLLPFKSSRLTIGLASIFCCGQRLRFVATPRILQAHFHASEAGSAFAAPSISIQPTIRLVPWPFKWPLSLPTPNWLFIASE